MDLRDVARTATGCALVALAACGADGGLPDRDPEVRGTVHRDISGATVLTGASDAYFEGMTLDRGGPVVVGTDAEQVEVAELRDGDTVEVWVGGPCAESFPVQCEIEAVRQVG